MDILLIVAGLSAPTFFGWCWLIGKVIKHKVYRNICACVATILVTPLLYLGLFFAGLEAITYYPKRDFTEERWDSAVETRYELSNDLIESRLLLGRSKAEVRQLLGEKEKSESKNCSPAYSDCWHYYMGSRPTILIGGFDWEQLNIYFQDDKVSEVTQHKVRE